MGAIITTDFRAIEMINNDWPLISFILESSGREEKKTSTFSYWERLGLASPPGLMESSITSSMSSSQLPWITLSLLT